MSKPRKDNQEPGPEAHPTARASEGDTAAGARLPIVTPDVVGTINVGSGGRSVTILPDGRAARADQLVLTGTLRVTVTDEQSHVYVDLPAAAISGSSAYVQGTIPPGKGELVILCIRLPEYPEDEA